MTRPRRITAPLVIAYLAEAPQHLVAKLLGLSHETVRDRIRKGEWETVGRTKLDFFAVLELERKRLRTGPVSLEQARLKRAQAERLEHDNQLRAGGVVPLEVARAMVADLCALTAQTFDNLGARIAPLAADETEPGAIIALVNEEADAYRAQLAQIAADLGVVGAGESDSGAAARAPAGRVGRRKSKIPRRKRRSR